MIQRKQGFLFLIFLLSYFLFTGCTSKKIAHPIFEVLDDTRTGLHFNNKLTSTEDLNLFKYMYFYNGSGVGAGDFNNDGKIDLFFAANQGDNKMYLNEGDLHFRDITETVALPQDKGWSTGVSLVDINNDGFLDIYICKVGNFETLKSHNQLLVCGGLNKAGLPFYTDQSAAYGLDFSGFSTQSVFFDYDGDGDLDMYLLNHSLHQNTNFDQREPLLNRPSPVSGDRLFRNDGIRFTDVTKDAGINSSVIGYGLGVVVSDVNLDGLPDIYVGNDFHENDYLYINQGKGKFKESLTTSIMHTSKYTMGVDAADLNNDAYPEIITMDMLAENPYILKRSLGDDEYDLFNKKIAFGYNYQYSRNNLQYNRGNGLFSEVGLYSGIAATDWSWSPLFFDFDNDGLKDLFISNGIPKRMNDIDFINYVSTEGMQRMINENKMNEANMALIDKFPQIKIPNKLYRNTGKLVFRDAFDLIENNKSCYSNGAVYADLDNDGDLDIVVNNIDEAALVYENKLNVNNDEKNEAVPSLEINIKGPEQNRHAIGARLFLFANGEVRTYEKYPVRGFMSSMETSVHVGLKATRVDSLILLWPDNTCQKLTVNPKESSLTVTYTKGLPAFSFDKLTRYFGRSSKTVSDITEQVNLKHLHIENPFVEFDREPLIPHMVSTEGPALAVADVNEDGMDDVYIGSSKGNKPALFLQHATGKFLTSIQPAFDNDSTYEDVDAAFVDVNHDGHTDLVVASGGNEYFGQDKFMMPRVYLNDGKAGFTKADDAFSGVFVNASCIVPYDINGDGFEDLFIGGRSVPWEYGQIPRSYLLLNNGRGKFKDVTSTYSKTLGETGMVTGAIWCDIDNDKDKDLLVCCEWGRIDAYINNNGSLTRRSLTDKNGWWNFLLPCDIDNDGDMDLIAGNQGLNSRLKASDIHPVKLYYEDFDGNGKKEQVVTYYIGDKEFPFTNKMELEKQLPVLKKRFLKAEDFARSTLEEILTAGKLKSAKMLAANYFSNVVLINKGNGVFDLKSLPWQAQLTTYRDATIVNANDDGLPDILFGGNYYDNNIQLGRNDADFGTLLINKGKGNFECENLHGLSIKGQVRHIRKLVIGHKEAYILVRNNDSTKVIQFGK